MCGELPAVLRFASQLQGLHCPAGHGACSGCSCGQGCARGQAAGGSSALQHPHGSLWGPRAPAAEDLLRWVSAAPSPVPAWCCRAGLLHGARAGPVSRPLARCHTGDAGTRSQVSCGSPRFAAWPRALPAPSCVSTRGAGVRRQRLYSVPITVCGSVTSLNPSLLVSAAAEKSEEAVRAAHHG